MRCFALLLLSLGTTVWAGPCEQALIALRANPNQGELGRYETTRILTLGPQKPIDSFRPETGADIVRRDAEGNATEARLRVLSDNPGNRIQVVSELNGWGLRASPSDELRPVPGTPYFEGVVPVRHGMEYRLLLNGTQVLDPSAEMHTTAEYSALQGRTGPAYARPNKP